MKADGLLVPKNLRLRATRRNSSTDKAKPTTIEPNRFRGTDMTRIMLPQSGWACLHIVIDWGDKKLLAAHLSRTSRSQDWITALEQAVASEFPMGIRDLPAGYDVPELVSDHGSQPAPTAFRGACEALGINQIFASYGNPKGNADTERMMRTIKEDLIYSNDFQTFNELETALATWTKRYNEEFLHSTLGYEKPNRIRELVLPCNKKRSPLFDVLKFIRDFWPANVLASPAKGDQYTVTNPTAFAQLVEKAKAAHA